VADQKEADKKKGPKGGVRHTPGRGHARKSGLRKKARFAKKAAKKRQKQQEGLRKQWADWDALPPEVQWLLPERKPQLPRPSHEK
jgi:hypothetical protein